MMIRRRQNNWIKILLNYKLHAPSVQSKSKNSLATLHPAHKCASTAQSNHVRTNSNFKFTDSESKCSSNMEMEREVNTELYLQGFYCLLRVTCAGMWGGLVPLHLARHTQIRSLLSASDFIK